MKKLITLAMVLSLLLAMAVPAGAIAPNAANTRTVTIDGSITADEWGAPVWSGNHESCWALNPTGWDYWQNTTAPADQTVNIYLTKDGDNIYLGVQLVNAAGFDDACAAEADWWAHAHLNFTLAAYRQDTKVPRIEFNGEFYEQYSSYKMGLVNGTDKFVMCASQGMDTNNLTDEMYDIGYDADTKTYTYEVAIPYEYTNIDLSKDGAVVLSMDLGDAPNGGVSNRFHISTAAQLAENGLGAGNFAHATKNPLVVNIIDTKIGDTAAAIPDEIVLDGVVTEEEWGEPVVITTPGHAAGTWDFWEYHPAGLPANQSARLYVTNDRENLYLAFVMDNCEEDTACTDAPNLWQSAHFAFAVSRFDEDTTVPIIEFNGDDYEQYSKYIIGMVNGQPAQINLSQGVDPQDLAADQFAVKYDADAKTYTYEVCLPYSMTNIDLYEGLDIALSVRAAMTKTDVAAPANVYFITTGYERSGGPGKIAMGEAGGALKITLNDATKKVTPYVRDTVAPTPAEPIKIDGSITVDEWGEPVIVTTPAHCKETWDGYWEFDAASVPKGQSLQVYMTNDGKYIYIGAVMDECDYDDSCTDGAMLYKAPHFEFTFSQYDEEFTVKRIEFQDEIYEQYTGFMLGIVNGKPHAGIKTQGIDYLELGAENFSIKYDPATRTYTYEARVPFSNTNIDIKNNAKIALSISAAMHYTGGDGANRYVLTSGSAFSGGAGNFSHLDNALVMNLNLNPNTGDMDVWMIAMAAVVAAVGMGTVLILRRRACKD